MAKVKHCGNLTQICWTSLYLVTWMMLALGSLIYHIAIANLVPTMTDLPDNLKAGFYEVFKFNNMESESLVVKSQSSYALTKCGLTASTQCSTMPNPSPMDRSSVTAAEKTKIVAAFTSSLTPILNICRDKYFGTPDLQGTAQSLEDMLGNITAVNSAGAPCIGTNVFYCNIHSSANMVVDQVSTVTTQIDAFIESDMVKTYKDNAGYLKLLHALPYLSLGPAALFFFCFWMKAGTCCCCRGGGWKSCLCFLIPHGIFWLLFFIINTILVALGIVVKYGQDRIEIPVLVGTPTLDVFVQHLQTTYPDFWDLVFKDMVASLDFMFSAFLMYEIFAIVILVYGLCMCCCRPYTVADDSTVHVM